MLRLLGLILGLAVVYWLFQPSMPESQTIHVDQSEDIVQQEVQAGDDQAAEVLTPGNEAEDDLLKLEIASPVDGQLEKPTEQGDLSPAEDKNQSDPLEVPYGSLLDPDAVAEEEAKLRQQLSQEGAEAVSHSIPLWTPFATKGKALGFAYQLKEQTGFEFTVQQLEIDQFQVMMPYSDEQAKQDQLAVLREKTGLSL